MVASAGSLGLAPRSKTPVHLRVCFRAFSFRFTVYISSTVLKNKMCNGRHAQGQGEVHPPTTIRRSGLQVLTRADTRRHPTSHFQGTKSVGEATGGITLLSGESAVGAGPISAAKGLMS